MKDRNNHFDGAVVFERPLVLQTRNRMREVYGFLFNQEYVNSECKYRDTLETYTTYLVGLELFLKNGGIVSGDGKWWYHPHEYYRIECKLELLMLVSIITKNMLPYKIIRLDREIEYEEDELDDILVVSKELMDRLAEHPQKEKHEEKEMKVAN